MENEIELIKGCRAGKDSARKELYTLSSKQMLAVCFRYTGDMDAAHDVLHDGFIKIFTNFSFRGESSLCTWITRVMVTQSLDFLRELFPKAIPYTHPGISETRAKQIGYFIIFFLHDFYTL